MCRFLIYKGQNVFMSDLLTRADQSLIMQSHHAREREEPLNGDGFGVGWYVPEVDPIPCVFTSTSPAWSSRNLHRLADKISSGCFFAHVRAASAGTFVSEANCHPFQYQQFLWMHNGGIAEFGKIKRQLREMLSDETYNLIQGTTDSEHVFALLIENLLPRLPDYTPSDLCNALAETIETIQTLCRKSDISDPCRLNFGLTDGRTVIATKFVTDPGEQPHTLYVAEGERFENQDGVYVMTAAKDLPEAIIIASEPVTIERSYWKPVPVNHCVMVTPEFQITTSPLS